MKILAVIPARAGSKGIPNKNIRIVNGYPLVYYAIKNAMMSKYITDVIVTTDSDSVRIIATQMGASFKWRDEQLCEDNVTLDEVVEDAIPEDINWDYIITMQPTSPTLKTETLDAAIKYTVESQYDTVLSAINNPHLSWSEKDGVKIPNYEKRLNRQFLPASYSETGAFVISKYSTEAPFVRIGGKVDIFEIPEDESIDIDSFIDLRSVEAIMKSPKVAIYVNGNSQRGIGHIYRALEIADEFYVKPDIYYDINQTNAAVFGQTTHRLIPADGISGLLECCKKEQYSLFINDILNTSVEYMDALKCALPKAKIVNFEDVGEGAQKADLVFNALLEDRNLPRAYSGEKYYIPSKLFMFYKPIKINEKVKSVFICFGGADPCNYTERMLEMIKKSEYESFNFIVALGRAKENAEELLEYNRYSNISVLYDVKNMPELMSECDIAVASRGRTAYELAMLGIPSIIMAQNARENTHSFISDENGFVYLGENPMDELIECNLKSFLYMSKRGREYYQNKLISNDLRGGRKRVMNLINNL